MREVIIRFELPAGDPYRELALTCRGGHLECLLVADEGNEDGAVRYWGNLEGGLAELLADSLERSAQRTLSDDRRGLLAMAAALRRVNEPVCAG